MKMRFGRFERKNFKDTDSWNRMEIVTLAMHNTVWFAIDTKRRWAKMVNERDVGAGTLQDLIPFLLDDEAIFVATEHAITCLSKEGPYVARGLFTDCKVEIELDDVLGMQGYLVTKRGITIVNEAPHLDLVNPSFARSKDDVKALFTDD